MGAFVQLCFESSTGDAEPTFQETEETLGMLAWRCKYTNLLQLCLSIREVPVRLDSDRGNFHHWERAKPGHSKVACTFA